LGSSSNVVLPTFAGREGHTATVCRAEFVAGERRTYYDARVQRAEPAIRFAGARNGQSPTR
jgi:hypothetical protein